MSTPRLGNECRVGIARQYFPCQVDSYNGGWPQKLGLPANVPSTAMPNFSNGLTGFPTQTVGIRGALTWQFSDSLTIVRGNHSIKTGFETRLLYGNNYQTSQPSGSFSFAAGLTRQPHAHSGSGGHAAELIVSAA